MKSCLFCSHLRWEKIEYTWYSTLTEDALDGGLGCYKGHFSTYDCRNVEDTAGFRGLCERAESCPDYTPEVA